MIHCRHCENLRLSGGKYPYGCSHRSRICCRCAGVPEKHHLTVDRESWVRVTNLKQSSIQSKTRDMIHQVFFDPELLKPGLAQNSRGRKVCIVGGWHLVKLVSKNGSYPNFALEEVYSLCVCIGVITYRRYYMARLARVPNCWPIRCQTRVTKIGREMVSPSLTHCPSA